jgi:hypothetical protein
MDIYNELFNNINKEIMKKRLSYNGKKVYIKNLTTNYALVSFNKEERKGLFKVDIKNLVEIE